MSRSPRRRRGRHLPAAPRATISAWIARLLVVGVGLLLIVGSLALLAGNR